MNVTKILDLILCYCSAEHLLRWCFCHVLIICGTPKWRRNDKRRNVSFPIKKCSLIIWCLPQSHALRQWCGVRICSRESENIYGADILDVIIFSANCIPATVQQHSMHQAFYYPIITTHTQAHLLWCGTCMHSLSFFQSLTHSHTQTDTLIHSLVLILTHVKFEGNACQICRRSLDIEFSLGLNYLSVK